MKPLIGVFVSGQMIDIFHRQIESTEFQVDFRIYDFFPFDPCQIPEDIDDLDVLLSTGYTAQFLKQKLKKPVVSLETSLYDTLRAVKTAVEQGQTPALVLYHNDNMILNFNSITSLINQEILIDCYDYPSEIDSIVSRYRGRDVCIIGSALACEVAARNGISHYFVYPEDSLMACIRLAEDMAVAIRRDLERSQQMTAVIHNSKQGIVLTDNTGRVLLCNSVMCNAMKKARKDVIGQSLGQMLPAYTLKSLHPGYSADDTGPGEVVKISDKRYIISEIPIRYANRLGHIVLFVDDIHTVQQNEYRIREVLSKKGFVAKRHFEDYTSFNPEFQRTVQIAKRFARSDEPVVITGETGTGKEVMAQCIHNRSSRANLPFVAVNCSAIAENLLESELFGYDAGAFSGANKGGKKGLFEIAHRGSLFLDELSEMSTSLQSKLLRAIQEKEFMHVGGTELIHFDVRIITASNKNLWNMVLEKKFREDLYYRINVLSLTLPPLYKRKEDILYLFLGFVRPHFPALAALIEENPRPLESLLSSYHWPGNIRELENTAKIVSVALGGEDVSLDYFLQVVGELLAKNKDTHLIQLPPGPARRKTAVSDMPFDSEKNRDRAEEARRALAQFDGNRTKAAASLRISRTTLWRWLSPGNANLAE